MCGIRRDITAGSGLNRDDAWRYPYRDGGWSKKSNAVIRLNPGRRRLASHIGTIWKIASRNRRKNKRWVSGAVWVTLLFVAWGSNGHVRVAVAGDEFSGGVTRVVDGDTFHIGGIDAPVRLWGADAAEADEPGGAAATITLKRLALGDEVHCKQMAADRYGRIVARCLTDQGDDITEVLINSGAVEEYVFYTGGFYAQRKLRRMLFGER